MNARPPIEGTSYTPGVVKAMGEAFDRAWRQIATNFGDEPCQVDAARMRLADAVISIASESSIDVEALKNGALQAMACDYRTGIVRPKTKT